MEEKKHTIIENILIELAKQKMKLEKLPEFVVNRKIVESRIEEIQKMGFKLDKIRYLQIVNR